MKQYFAKYLPVEGEIKEGDYYITATDYQKVRKCEDRSWGTFEMCKKVKLFLCSRDIQVGDNIWAWDSSGNDNNLVDDFGIVLSLEYGGVKVKPKNRTQEYIRYSKEEVVKVVGEISPDATWFKEGDEFNEEEVQRNHICYDNSFGSGDSYCFHCGCSTRCLSEDYNYLIKGPCGHFH